MLKDLLPLWWGGLALGALVSSWSTGKRGRLWLTLWATAALVLERLGAPLALQLGMAAVILSGLALGLVLRRWLERDPSQ